MLAFKSESLQKVKSIIVSQYNDPAKYEYNKRRLRAAGIFGSAIIIMRNYGDAMAI